MANSRTPQIIARVRIRVDNLASGTVGDSSILRLLDEAQRDLCVQLCDAALYSLAHVHTGTLTLNSNPYALPDRFLRERALQYRAGGPMATRWQVHRLSELTANVNLVPSADRPFYFLWDNQLYIEAGTKTAGSYFLYYLRTPADLTTATDPELPVEYDSLLETFAAMRCWEARAAFDEAETLWGEYLGRCATINSRYGPSLPFDGIAGDRR